MAAPAPRALDGGGRRKIGRPARLNREMIAEAAHQIGLSNLTMQAVAEHLEVSVPGLYHYVEGKQDLLRLAAEYSAARIRLPDDHGQHWAGWLFEWANYNHAAFVEQPELLVQFLEGAIDADRTVDNIDRIIGLLVRQGFSVTDAELAYSSISELAIGAAVGEIRRRVAASGGRPAVAEYHRLLAQREPDDLPYVRLLAAELAQGRSSTFRDQLMTLLLGICTRRGEAWAPIAEELAGIVDARGGAAAQE